jgi:hypothetical protein
VDQKITFEAGTGVTISAPTPSNRLDPVIVEIDQGNEVEGMEEWDLENALIAAGAQWEVWGGP